MHLTKRLAMLLFALVGFVVLQPVSAKEKAEFTDFSKPILVQRNQPSVVVKLPANRSTGYSWMVVHYDPMLVVPLTAKYVEPKKPMPGKKGEVAWQFRIKPEAFKVPHIITIDMLYAQPWEVIKDKRNVKTLYIVTE